MEIWASFSGGKSMIFKYFALNPCSLYLGSCSFGLWLPTQFGEFRISLLITTFVLLIILRFFEV